MIYYPLEITLLSSVNTASRMESSSLPMRIQISEVTRCLLDNHKTYIMVPRGQFVVKVGSVTAENLF